MFLDSIEIWSFAARIFFRNMWFWLLIGLAQAYLFALGLLLVGLGSFRLFAGAADSFLAVLAHHIHLSGILSYVAGNSAFGRFAAFLLGLLVACCAFWLHFCVSQYAAYEWSPFGPASGRSCRLFIFIPRSLNQFLKVIGVSFFVSIVTGLGMVLGVVPGIFLHVRLFAAFPLLVDFPQLSFVQAITRSWCITRNVWRSILLFSFEALVLYMFLMYLASYLFLVTVVPLARYAWYRLYIKL